MLKRKPILLFLFPLVFAGCVKELDFEQIEELALEPVLVSNLILFTVDGPQLAPAQENSLFISDTTRIEFFNQPAFANNLDSASLFFEFTNTLSRSFTAELLLLNEVDEALFSHTFSIAQGSASQPSVTSEELLFEGTDANIIKRTDKLALNITLNPGTPIPSNSTGYLQLKSSGTFYMYLYDD